MGSASLLAMLAKCVAVGFLAAAPTGPSGVLVIQRTLNKNRMKGFQTGLGVTVSDAIYIFITMMCLSLVLGYLENPTVALVVKLVGCALLMVFGIVTVRSNPLAKSKGETVVKESWWQFTLSGFLVAIVNPLVVFFYMGLFTFFSVPVDDLTTTLKAEAYLATLVGDVCWWLTLTFLINKLRNRFDLRGLWMINRILGTILIVASVGWLVLILIKL